MKRAGRRLTYANVMSTLALFVAVGGATAFAANQLAPKSVGERQLRPGAVTAEKLRKNAVIAPKIKALAVKRGKLASGAVDTSKLVGGAVAAEKLGAGAVTTEKIGAEAVTGDKVNEGTLGQVPSAAKADFATSAESANPLAFAKVDQEGNVDLSNSKGIAGVTVGSEPGIYCISAAGFSPRGAQVTIEYPPNGGSAIAYVKIGGSECAAPRVLVQTFSGNSRNKEPFYVALYR